MFSLKLNSTPETYHQGIVDITSARRADDILDIRGDGDAAGKLELVIEFDDCLVVLVFLVFCPSRLVNFITELARRDSQGGNIFRASVKQTTIKQTRSKVVIQSIDLILEAEYQGAKHGQSLITSGSFTVQCLICQ